MSLTRKYRVGLHLTGNVFSDGEMAMTRMFTSAVCTLKDEDYKSTSLSMLS